MTTKAFEDGFDAYFEGAEVSANPHKMTSDEYQDWENGFYQAMSRDNQEEL